MISKRAIKRLRLKEGDIVLVRDYQTMQNLIQASRNRKGMNLPNCPIVIAPEGVHRLSKEYLAKLICR